MKILKGQQSDIENLPEEELGKSTLITGHCFCPQCRVMNYYIVAKVTPAITSVEQGMQISSEPFSLECCSCKKVSDLSKYPRRPVVSGKPEDLVDAGFNEASAFKLMTDPEFFTSTFTLHLVQIGAETMVKRFTEKLVRKKCTIADSVAIVAMFMFDTAFNAARDETDQKAIFDWIDLIHRASKLYAVEFFRGSQH